MQQIPQDFLLKRQNLILFRSPVQQNSNFTFHLSHLRLGHFSLIELIIVLVLLGTIMGIVIPRVGYVAWGIRKAEIIKNIHSAFHMASSIATATGTTTTLVFDLNGEKIQVQRRKASDFIRSFEDDPDPTESVSIFDDVSQFLLPPKTVLDPNSFNHNDDNRFEYRFFSNGEAVGPQLELLISGTHPMTIDVDRLTGRPLLSENEN